MSRGVNGLIENQGAYHPQRGTRPVGRGVHFGREPCYKVSGPGPARQRCQLPSGRAAAGRRERRKPRVHNAQQFRQFDASAPSVGPYLHCFPARMAVSAARGARASESRPCPSASGPAHPGPDTGQDRVRITHHASQFRRMNRPAPDGPQNVRRARRVRVRHTSQRHARTHNHASTGPQPDAVAVALGPLFRF
jgi:hypothetical protein